MTELSKIKLAHTQRGAFVYVGQSSPAEVEHNRESTERQYALVDRAVELAVQLAEHSELVRRPGPGRCEFTHRGADIDELVGRV